jgi:hypothetical protein
MNEEKPFLFQDRIDEISDRTGLAVVESRAVGLSGLQQVLTEAIERNTP